MFKVNRNYSTLTPESIMPVLEQDEWFKKLSPKIIENAMLFCTVLYLHQYYYKEKNGENAKDEKNPFQRIGTDLIIKILARDYYKEILSRLAELKIIEINDSYFPGKLSKSYRLTDEFLNQKPIARKLKYTPKKIEKLNEYFIENNLDSLPYLLNQYNNMQLIHIDFENAIKFIEDNKDSIRNTEHYYRQVHKVNAAYTRKISVSPRNRRVHTSLTSFPKKLRKFLCLVDTHSGEMNFSQCVIDGKNTQPLLICIKMKREGREPDTDFLEFCLNGTLYDEMAKELNESRCWVKEYMMKAILFTPQNSEYTEFKNMRTKENLAKKKIAGYFRNRFPIVYKWLLTKKNELRKANYFHKKKNIGGSLLAYEIQKMEAELWIHQLLKELQNDMIYITIHDSIVLFNPSEDQVKFISEKIREIGNELYNIDIPLSIEYSVK